MDNSNPDGCSSVRTGCFVKQLYAGKAQTTRGKCSGFIKGPVDGPKRVTTLGFADDDQVYKTHGGLERALLHYDTRNYPKFEGLENVILPEGTLVGKGACFGENIATDSGLSEDQVCIGDIYSLGTTLLQVTEPRFPCSKIDFFNETTGVRLHALKSGMSGWFYSVLEEGEINQGDEFILEKREHPEYTARAVLTGLFGNKEHKRTSDEEWLKGLVAIDCLGKHMLDPANRHLNKLQKNS
eukprot:CAMPEP_0174258078 /NCGR_PEP_ID=MMETSP0439-20130205/7139_1 /TAXON_ID=0 /ORGANISM="Stereomyxa ramosa, Strain Chinc5" /LENGTH=239 /DNA_ID=CAMNT_0015341441 /DNA_START=10 /DNA_END=729 /DNA_ORIENTATION=-